MEIKSKLWIEIDGEPVFGRGRRFLLEAIEKHGSINQAAKEVHVSYRRAWSYIKSMEERLGIKFVDRQAGGRNGGGAALTEEAREFLKKYERMEEGILEMINERFREIFLETGVEKAGVEKAGVRGQGSGGSKELIPKPQPPIPRIRQ